MVGNSQYNECEYSDETFNFLLSYIEHDITKKETAETPISASKRLAVCLCKLARGNCYYTISEMTGVGESTVIKIVDEVCQVIAENMWHEFVEKYFPKSKE